MNYLRKYYIFIFILLFMIILFFNQQNFNRTEAIIKSNYNSEIQLIKNNVFNSLENAFTAYSISEVVLNNEMRENSRILLDKYLQDSDAKNWDLSSIKLLMPDYEIYIIDQDLKIVNTTLAADLGLDFSRYTDFSRLLHSRMEGEKFIADKLDLAQNTGHINKYSYQPVPDNQYLLQLSINIAERFPKLENLNIFSISEQLTAQYEQLRSINFYKFGEDTNRVGLLNSSNPSELQVVTAGTKNMVKKTATANRKQINTRAVNSYQITDVYLPFLVSGDQTDSEWWNSFVVRVSYDNHSLVEQLEEEKKFFVFDMSMIFIIFLVFSLIMSYFIHKTEEMALQDHLTGLPNRKAFEKYFNQENNKNFNQKLAILYLDLDGFKEVNDNYGHDTGDLLLKTVAVRLKNIIRSGDKVSRMGGDEFTVLLTDIESSQDVEKIVKKIEKKIAEPYQINGKKVSVSCSIGYSIDYRANQSFQELINKADLAMYEIKNEKN